MSLDIASNGSFTLDFKSCGWILGFEIYAADARGAKVYRLEEAEVASEASLDWLVDIEPLGVGESGELVALICKRKGLFSSAQTQAVLAWRMHDGFKMRLKGAGGAVADRGGAMVPTLSTAQDTDLTPLNAALHCIQSLNVEGLESLSRAISSLLEAKQAHQIGMDELVEALSQESVL